MLITAVGHSPEVDTEDAVAAVIAQATDALRGRPPQAGLLLLGVEYDRDLALRRVRERFGPDLHLIGCTTGGEFTAAGGHTSDAVLLILFAADRLRFCAGVGRGLSRDPAAAARAAVADARRGLTGPPALCITTPDSLTANLSDVVDALQDALPGVPILGGTSAEQRQREPTYQLFAGEVLQDALPVLLVSGPARLGWGVASGWTPVGDVHEVTAAQGNVLREIDGRPALEVLKAHLGERMDFVAEFPLAVQQDGGVVLRAVFGGDEASGAVTLAGAVHAGDRFRFTAADRDGVLRGAREALEQALDGYRDHDPQAALVFSCAGRRWVLGSRASEEVQLLARTLQERGLPGVPLAGFFSYGEIAPRAPGRPARYHNETCVVLLLGEEAPPGDPR